MIRRDIIYVTIKPEPLVTVEETSYNRYRLPGLTISETTTVGDIIEYRNSVLAILKEFKENTTLEAADEKRINKVIQDIVESLSNLIVAVKNDNKKAILAVATRLHNFIQTFNITGTLHTDVKSLGVLEREVKLKQFLIESIMSKLS
jgi:hypothetical protein